MMKLILANNQTPTFVKFYQELKAESPTPFDYSPYNSLIFWFNTNTEKPIEVYNLSTKQDLGAYDGIYINGYLNNVELASTVAICADALGIAYVNQEIRNAPSLSKLSGYAKLAAAKVSIPRTVGGCKAAIVQAEDFVRRLSFPAVLKRADADRGIDNFKVASYEQAKELLEKYEDGTVWILQEFVDNDGFYLVSFYDSKPAFCIFRTLEERPYKDEQKAHMFKPAGGVNARLIDLEEAPKALIETSQRAINAMNRQVGSVDCLYDSETNSVHVLEVNYNPQLVTIKTFKETRVKAFLENLKNIKKT